MKFMISLFVLMLLSIPAVAQDVPSAVEAANIASFETCSNVCAPYEADEIIVATDGTLQGCVCQSRRLTRQDGGICLTCCTPGTSQPCGNACISMERTCHLEEPGSACYCPEE